jgi:hypothetical protein
VVSARTAWNETAGQATTCELLRRTITVKERLSTNVVLAGAGGAALVLVAGIVIFVRKRHAHLQAILVSIFTEVPPPYDDPNIQYCCGISIQSDLFELGSVCSVGGSYQS